MLLVLLLLLLLLLLLMLLAALGAKVGYEAFYGKTLFVQDMGGFVPVPIAHLAGALAGTAVALMPKNVFKSGEAMQCQAQPDRSGI